MLYVGPDLLYHGRGAGSGRTGGERVWYFQCFGHLLEESDKYTVTYENMGHYGFQYMDGNTDFDILKVNITEETGND